MPRARKTARRSSRRIAPRATPAHGRAPRIPLAEIGTDRNRLDSWNKNAAVIANKVVTDMGIERKGLVEATLDGYIAAFLDGIWLRAPYLHNGSVPSLRDLLEPAANRPTTFYRGYDVYDPVKVGFVTEGAEAERLGTELDVGAESQRQSGSRVRNDAHRRREGRVGRVPEDAVDRLVGNSMAMPSLAEMFGRLIRGGRAGACCEDGGDIRLGDPARGRRAALRAACGGSLLHIQPLADQAADYLRIIGLLASGVGMLYAVSGRLNALGFVFASLLDRPLVPPIMAVLWYLGIVPASLALVFAVQDFAGFLWTLGAWRAEFANRAK